MRTTQLKGDIAVTQAIATFTRLGMEVSLPVTESAAYDLVVEENGYLYKVQVRYCGNGEVELRRIHSNSKGYVIKKTKILAYDWLYVYEPSGDEYLYRKCFEGRRSLKPSKEFLI